MAGSGHTCRPPAPCKGGGLLLLSSPSSCPPALLPLTETVSCKDVDDTFKVSALAATLKLLLRLLPLSKSLPSAPELWAPFLPVVAALPRDFFPGHLKKLLEELEEEIGGLKGGRTRVVRPNRQVSWLALN